MTSHSEYKVISGPSPAEFSRELLNVTSDGWRPILLTSCAAGTATGTGMAIVAIVEKSRSGN